MHQLYTIGHSTYPLEQFIGILKKHCINCVVDVRSVPFSKYSPQYNMNELKTELKKNKIYYIFMGEEFGARRSDKSLYHAEGYVDFEKVINCSLFKTGVERIKAGLKKGYRVAFMCTEKDPIECHRNILVARAFHIQEYDIYNILSNGEIETQEQLESRLLDIYFPDRNQCSLLDYFGEKLSLKEMLIQAYRERNKEIGYKDSNEEVSKAL